MEKTIEIPEGYEARIEGNKVILEPKESEDERIRKELLEEIEFIIPHDDETDSEGLILPSYHARIDRYKSYLEKQKEQKPESCDCSRDEESYTNGIHHVLMNPEAYGLIKQKHTEWSEEDESAFGDLIWCIEQARKSAKDENDMGNIWYAENWLKERLKSLRPSWKPSEEQMWALDVALENFYHKDDRAALESLRTDLKNYFSHEIH